VLFAQLQRAKYTACLQVCCRTFRAARETQGYCEVCRRSKTMGILWSRSEAL